MQQDFEAENESVLSAFDLIRSDESNMDEKLASMIKMLEVKDDLSNLSTKVHEIENIASQRHSAKDFTVNAKIHKLAKELDTAKKDSLTNNLQKVINELLDLDDEAFANLSLKSRQN